MAAANVMPGARKPLAIVRALSGPRAFGRSMAWMVTTPQPNARVLVIDDDEQYLKLTARMLRSAGYDVVTRLDALGTSAAVAATRPDLVLIDLNMPTLDGDRLAPLIQRSVSNPPLIVLHSGMNEKILRERAKACGANACIPKGLSPDRFLARVADVLGTSAASSRRDVP
jgi:two-component system, OmpR family, response regulator